MIPRNAHLPAPALCGLLLACAACVTDPIDGGLEYSLVQWTPEREYELGEAEAPGLEQELDAPLADLEAQRVLSELVREIAQHSPRRDELDFRATVVASSEPNAMALPGGRVYVTRGLLAEVDSEAELVAVLGHEIGHAEHRHAMTGSSKGALIGLPAIPFEWLSEVLPVGHRVAGFTGAVLGAPSRLVNLKFSREAELEADRRGAYYAHLLGYDPRELRRVYERGSDHRRSALLSTHPSDADRMKALDREIRRRYPEVAGREPAEFRGTGSEVQGVLDRLREQASAYGAFDEARRLLGGAQGDEDLQAAWEALARALEEVPGEPLFWVLAGELSLAHEDPAGARLAFLRADTLYRRSLGDRGHWKPPFYLGVFDLGLGASARAEQRFASAQLRAPAHPSVRYYRGLALEALGRYEEALAAYGAARALAGDDEELRAAIDERRREVQRRLRP
jgi:predicted Zn-dependent protease